MRCHLCSGSGLVQVAARNGYHVYKGCPACHGTGTLPPRPKAEDD